MRKHIIKLAHLVAENLPVQEPIYEFGALQVPGQEEFANLRRLFPGREYIGADMREGLGVDRVLDLHDIDLASESVGTVLSFDTLEHVEYPRRALQEIYRILKPSGLVVITSVMNFPIHDYPFDYWRFTPEAFRSILKHFESVFVGCAGKKSFPHTVVGVGFRGEAPDISTFLQRFDQWEKAQKFELETIVRNLTPPFVLPALSHLRSILISLNMGSR